MKRNKRVLAMALAFAMGVGLTGCGSGNASESESVSQSAGTEVVTAENGGENLIQNGDFSDGLTNWGLYMESGGNATQSVNADGEMEIDVSDPGTVSYAIQPYYDGFRLQQGCVYAFSFDVHTDTERTIEWRLQLNGGDYHAYTSGISDIGEEVVHISNVFTMEEETDPAPRLCVNMGGTVDGCPSDLGAHTIYFDNFTLYLMDDSGAVASESAEEAVNINVNQVGYLPDAKKKAVVRGETGTDLSGSFDVVNADTGEIVYTGTLAQSKENEASDEQTAIADFTDVTEPGTYKVVTADYGESFPFAIGEDVYEDLTASALHMFYLQRCGQEVSDDEFSHAACHTDTATVYGTDQTVEVSGGWHDAGDYGRYTVAGAKAACDLMLTYENYGGSEELLEEIQYELDWMLDMQDASTGGVYHKITCANFPDTVSPEEETDQLILSPISTTATADFAATMAMAARVFAGDANYQAACLAAAKSAWSYLENNPSDGVGFTNPDGIVTGEYGDSEDADERYWALAELYKTTGDAAYLTRLESIDPSGLACDLGWQSVGIYGMYAYLTAGGGSAAYTQTVENRFYALVDEALDNADADAYSVAIGIDGYYWGSNMGVANKGMLFLMANQLAPDARYVTAAEEQLDYLLGNNTNSYCFVTGYGTLSPTDPHHRPSEVKGEAISGMLVGGPNRNLEDSYAQGTLTGKASAACYVDNVQCYSCNEVTIYWNSPLVYLLTGVQQ